MASEKESRVPSVLTPESIRVIGETMGVSGLTDEAASFLAEDISYRLKLLVQEAEKLRRHGKRRKLMCSDFDSALQLKNIEPVYGVSGKDGQLPFRHASGGGRELYFTDDKEVDLQAVLQEQAVKIPLEPTLKTHWLSINGVQPSLPENPPPASKDVQKKEILDTKLKSTKPAHPDTTKHKHHHSKHKDAVKLKNLSTHELSVEQQFYYKEITESCVGPDELKRAEALTSLQQDPGLHQMLPRFIAFASEGVKINVVQNNLALLIYLMRMVKSMLDNQTVFLDKYLHDLLPTVMTCVVSRQLCMRPDMDNHWALRDFAARLVAHICRNYSNNTNDLQARVTKIFTEAIMNETAALATLYGAIAGLGELGTEVIKSCLLPYICLLGERIKSANEGSALSIDKIAAEHIKKQLMKYLPNVLKAVHTTSDSLDEFNIGYGYLGPMMHSMFQQKEKSIQSASSAVHTLAPPRPVINTQRPQIVIQQPSTPQISSSSYLSQPPVTPRALSSLPALPSTPTGISRSLSSLPSTPTGSAQKFVIVTQARPSTPGATSITSSSVVKLMTSQATSSSMPQAPVSSISTPQQKFVVIQGGAKTEGPASPSVRTSIISGTSLPLQQQPTSNPSISRSDLF